MNKKKCAVLSHFDVAYLPVRRIRTRYTFRISKFDVFVPKCNCRRVSAVKNSKHASPGRAAPSCRITRFLRHLCEKRTVNASVVYLFGALVGSPILFPSTRSGFWKC